MCVTNTSTNTNTDTNTRAHIVFFYNTFTYSSFSQYMTICFEFTSKSASLYKLGDTKCFELVN